jgi:hypothetical protein
MAFGLVEANPFDSWRFSRLKDAKECLFEINRLPVPGA